MSSTSNTAHAEGANTQRGFLSRVLSPFSRFSRPTLLRLVLLTLVLLATIFISIVAPDALNGSYSDDGAANALVLLVYISIGVSVVCELPLLLIPRMRIFKSAFPFRRAQSTPEGAAKPRLHPALILTIELLAGGTTVSLQVVCALLGQWAFNEAVLVIGWLLATIAAVLHLVLFVMACKDVHRLRKEQKAKRSSLRAQPALVEDGVAVGDGGLQGWVELTEHDSSDKSATDKKTDGVGGGLSGVGKGY